MSRTTEALRDWHEHKKRFIANAVAEGYIKTSIAFREIAYLLFYKWYYRESKRR